jgi:hypothetical protein
MGLEGFRAQALPRGKEQLPRSKMAAVLVVARLC